MLKRNRTIILFILLLLLLILLVVKVFDNKIQHMEQVMKTQAIDRSN